MRIAVVEPSLYDRAGRLIRLRKLQYFGHTTLHVASLIPRDHDVEIVNDLLDEPDYDRPYDLVLLTSMGPTMERALEIASRYRARGVPCVVGGYSAWLYREKIEGRFDAIAVGEAEALLPAILSDAEAGALKPAYEMETLHSLAGLPEPRFDLLDLARYGILYPTHATRGCGHRCDFCIVTVANRFRHRKRPVDEVIRDLQIIRRHTRFVAFMDENLTFDRPYAKELLARMIPLKLHWMSCADLGVAKDEELLDLAYRSGCLMLHIGFESFRRENLEEVGKCFVPADRYDDLIARIHGKGILINALLMVGFDHDDISVFDAVYDFVDRNRLATAFVNIVSPIPHTAMYDRYAASGRLYDLPIRENDGMGVGFVPARMSREELEEGFWRLHERLYAWPQILKRLVRSLPRFGLFRTGVEFMMARSVRRNVIQRYPLNLS